MSPNYYRTLKRFSKCTRKQEINCKDTKIKTKNNHTLQARYAIFVIQAGTSHG